MDIRADHRQTQTLSPRLQHAVRLLQMSSLDFAAMVRDTLGKNPFLETEEGDEGEPLPAAASPEGGPPAGDEIDVAPAAADEREAAVDSGATADYDDGNDRDRYDPTREGAYRDGDAGYFRDYGPRDAYRRNYRDGFRQGYEGGYRDGAVLTSFLAAFPMRAPRYVTYVMLFEPKSSSPGGASAGLNAAPLTAKLIARVAPLLGLEPARGKAGRGL